MLQEVHVKGTVDVTRVLCQVSSFTTVQMKDPTDRPTVPRTGATEMMRNRELCRNGTGTSQWRAKNKESRYVLRPFREIIRSTQPFGKQVTAVETWVFQYDPETKRLYSYGEAESLPDRKSCE